MADLMHPNIIQLHSLVSEGYSLSIKLQADCRQWLCAHGLGPHPRPIPFPPNGTGGAWELGYALLILQGLMSQLPGWYWSICLMGT